MRQTYSLAVRALCEFTAKSGDLGRRFTPAPSARQGIAGHRIVAARRSAPYERELVLQGQHGPLTVTGRADGYDPVGNRLEEYKTHRGDLSRMAPNRRGLHWAQVKVYGALLCAQRSLASIELALVYFDIRTEREYCLTQDFSALELERHFQDHCERFLGWARLEMAHRRRRDAFLRSLKFPYPQLRGGQRQMSEAIYRAAMRAATVLVQAPTGVGKTLGSLFPALKAVPLKGLDKVLYLVARTSGRAPVLRALRRLASSPAPAPLRILELVAKQHACLYPGRACDGAACPLARGFYDKLPSARMAALAAGVLDRDTVRGAALNFDVCPYYLTLELARWCDVIVGDYHYFFDAGAFLHCLTTQNGWRVALLVDEAHNLLPRGRDMYSATLDSRVLGAARDEAPPRLQALLRRVDHGWQALARTQVNEYAVLPAIPAAFSSVLQNAVSAIADGLAEPDGLAEQSFDHPGAAGQEALLRFYFDALRFARLAQDFGEHSLFDVTLDGTDCRLTIRNVAPGRFLSSRFAAADSTMVFSATLAPQNFYLRLLGLPESTVCIVVDSPFDPEQLDVRIEHRVSTRWRDRSASLAPIVDLMARQYALRAGNYLAFFSSFDYLHAVYRLFEQRVAHVPIWEQSRAMSPANRDAFLARFTPAGRGIGFAVLGGVFAEGIDLPGERLIGAFIATLGLPQMNPVNAAIEQRMQLLFDAGYEYTYLYPGLQKVVQAAGRVIRTLDDRGTVHLIDDRYRDTRIRALLPAWWRL